MQWTGYLLVRDLNNARALPSFYNLLFLIFALWPYLIYSNRSQDIDNYLLIERKIGKHINLFVNLKTNQVPLAISPLYDLKICSLPLSRDQ